MRRCPRPKPQHVIRLAMHHHAQCAAHWILWTRRPWRTQAEPGTTFKSGARNIFGLGFAGVKADPGDSGFLTPPPAQINLHLFASEVSWSRTGSLPLASLLARQPVSSFSALFFRFTLVFLESVWPKMKDSVVITQLKCKTEPKSSS